MLGNNFSMLKLFTQSLTAGMHAPPQGKGLPRPAPPRKKEALPRPVKITKTCGAQQGKVDFNPLKFGRQLQGRIQFCPINICLTHKSVYLRTFLPRPAPQTFTLTPVCPVNPWFTHLGKLSQIKPFFPLF